MWQDTTMMACGKTGNADHLYAVLVVAAAIGTWADRFSNDDETAYGC